MKIVIFDKINDKLGKVKCFHENAEMLEEKEKYSYIPIEEIPTFDEVPYKDKELYVNLETKEIFAEYKDRPHRGRKFPGFIM